MLASDAENWYVFAGMKCPDCWKPSELCICDAIVPARGKLRFLLLQHPQEARNPRSTARLVALTLPGTVHRVGLSWKSLRAALGEDVSPAEWGVLYVGQKKELAKLPRNETVHVLSKTKTLADLKGIVLLDGNWKQSKTLWWRNPWLLRLARIILTPERTESKYRPIARQPRKGCLCTLEAAAEILRAWGDADETHEHLHDAFERFLSPLRT